MGIGERLRPYFPFMAAFGIRRGFSIARKLFPKANLRGEIQVSIPQVKSPIHLRLGGTDVTNFLEIFMRAEFPLPADLKPKLIVDAGANIGMASLYFLNKYPGAKVIAIEPDSSNCEMIQKNCSAYSTFTLLQTGVWEHDGYGAIENPDAVSTAFRIRNADPSETGAFPLITIETVLKNSGLDRIGILKLDIEGAEAEVFRENYKAWIEKVDVLIVEMHDRIKPGCSVAFFSAMEKEPFFQFSKGENLVYIRKKG